MFEMRGGVRRTKAELVRLALCRETPEKRSGHTAGGGAAGACSPVRLVARLFGGFGVCCSVGWLLVAYLEE